MSPERRKQVKLPARRLREIVSPIQGDNLSLMRDELARVPPTLSANKCLPVRMSNNSNGM